MENKENVKLVRIIKDRDHDENNDSYKCWYKIGEQHTIHHYLKDKDAYVTEYDFVNYKDKVYILAKHCEILEYKAFLEKGSELVHSPKHYSVFDGIEAIEIIASSLTLSEFRGYCFGNLLKYRLRVGKKDDVKQELGKADKYQELFDKYQHLCKENQ